MEYPGIKTHPDDARRSHPVLLSHLEGVEEAPDVPDVELVEEQKETRAIAPPTTS